MHRKSARRQRMVLRPRFEPDQPGHEPPELRRFPPLEEAFDGAFMQAVAYQDQVGSEQRLTALLGFLQTPQGERVVRWAHRETLVHKLAQYACLKQSAEWEVARERDLIELKMPDLKRTSKVDGDQDNWCIFESISRKYMEAKDRATVFDAIGNRATAKLADLDRRSPDARLASELADALRLLLDFRSQPHIVGTVVDVVGAFLKNPTLIRTKFLNFLVAGAAGTGKTTLAGVIAKCLASAGMFVGDRVVCAGRAEFVAEYEGQTVARTRNFLISNLDAGVIFVDEAYGITQWNDGKPESYGTEAVTAMVEFMSQYKGLYCIITAGYEKEMQRYFLATNPGFARRFPFRFVLRDLSAHHLTLVFKRTLLTQQGHTLPPGSDDGDALESHGYFTSEAWRYLTMLVAYCTSGRVETVVEEYDRATRQTYSNVQVFLPTYPHMHQLFMNQAGSMTNLAEECVTVLMSKMPFGDGARRSRASTPFPRGLGVGVMQQVIRQRIMNSALSEAPRYLQELLFLERHM